ncbi:YrhB domain-containing protein [Actinomadura nitritigenes]|uniref:YrhB domain-containing protein n=1 Tax=Actinomadura nitritigenes TaxID=134602 RepID=UPI003D8E3892
MSLESSPLGMAPRTSSSTIGPPLKGHTVGLFTCTTASYIRSRDPNDGLAGVGPLLVLRDDGQIVPYTSIYTDEAALREYEQRLGLEPD